MTNTELLEEIIDQSGYKKAFLAEQVGLSTQGLRNCITNRAEFKASQIQTLCNLLRIDDPKQKEAIFFAQSGA